MRNLKKFLALVLAMMMVLGLMVTVSAADYTTDASITSQYKTAVDVLFELNVLQGGDDASYSPKDNIPRREFAMLLYRLGTGGTDDDASMQYNVYNQFTDVDNGAWYSGAVGYVFKQEWMEGDYGAGGPFRPDDDVNVFEAFVGLLRVAGYGKNGEYSDDFSWKVTAAEDARIYGLDAHLLPTTALSKPATRETVAELMFTLLTEMSYVRWSNNTNGGYVGVGSDNTVDPNISGNSRKIGEVLFDMAVTKVGDDDGNGGEIDSDDLLGLYPNDTQADAFSGLGPVSVLEVNGKVIHVEYPTPVKTYTGTVTAATIAKDLKGYFLLATNGNTNAPVNNSADIAWSSGSGTTKLVDSMVEDGAAAAAITTTNGTAAAAIASLTGPGKTVAIYTNTDTDAVTNNETSEKIIDKIVVINTYVGTVTKVTEAKDEDDVRTVRVKGDYGKTESYDFPTEYFAKDDVVLFTYSNGAIDNSGTGSVQSMQLAIPVSGTLQRVVNGTTLIMKNGDKYIHSTMSASSLKDAVANAAAAAGKDVAFYTDAQGNIIKDISANEETATSTNYIFVVGHSAAELVPGDYITEVGTADSIYVCEVYGVDGNGNERKLNVKFTSDPDNWDDGANQSACIEKLYTYKPNTDGTVTLSAAIGVAPGQAINVGATYASADKTQILNEKTAFIWVYIEDKTEDKTIEDIHVEYGSKNIGSQIATSGTTLGINGDGVVEVAFMLAKYTDPNAPSEGTGAYVLVDVSTIQAVVDADDGSWVQYTAYTSDGEEITVYYKLEDDEDEGLDKDDGDGTKYIVCELNNDNTVTKIDKGSTVGEAAGAASKAYYGVEVVKIDEDTVTFQESSNTERLTVSADTGIAPIDGVTENTELKLGQTVIYVKGNTTDKNGFDALAIWILTDMPEQKTFSIAEVTGLAKASGAKQDFNDGDKIDITYSYTLNGVKNGTDLYAGTNVENTVVVTITVAKKGEGELTGVKKITVADTTASKGTNTGSATIAVTNPAGGATTLAEAATATTEKITVTVTLTIKGVSADVSLALSVQDTTT